MIYTVLSLQYIKITRTREDICNTLFHALSQECVKQKWYSACLIQSIILQRILNMVGIKSIVEKGYLLQDDHYCWHTWLYVPKINQTLDCAVEVLKWICKEQYDFDDLKVSKSEPRNMKRMDMDTEEEVETLLKNNKLFDLHKQGVDVLSSSECPLRCKRFVADICNKDFLCNVFKT